MFLPFLVRHLGKEVNLRDLLTGLLSVLMSKAFFKTSLFLILTAVVSLCTCATLGYALIFLVREYAHNYFVKINNLSFLIYALIGFATIAVLAYLFIFVKITIESRKRMAMNKRSIAMLYNERQKGRTDIAILYSAKSYEQLIFWLQNDDNLMSEAHSIRAFSSFVLGVLRNERLETENNESIRPRCLISKKKNHPLNKDETTLNFKNLRQHLEDRLIKCFE